VEERGEDPGPRAPHGVAQGDGAPWAANASFSSTRSRSSTVIPARSRAFRVAGIGPTPIRWGSTPATAVATIRAMGSAPRAAARSSEATARAAAPSLMPEALPAVTVPSSRKTGGSLARISSVVPGRGCSSTSTSSGSPFRFGTSTGAISARKRPSSMAAAARRWLSAAKASCSLRPIPNSLATTSAVSPSPMVHSSGKAGLAKRHPRTVSATSGCPRA